MKDQLISYETAVLASELGYKGLIGLGVEYNLGQYYNSKGVLNGSCTDGIFQTINYHRAINKGETPEPVSSKVVAAPTQSLLQKWLREVHNLHIEISVNQFGYGYMYSIIDTAKCECVMLLTGGPNHKFTYEEALEKGLFEALKLIKE